MILFVAQPVYIRIIDVTIQIFMNVGLATILAQGGQNFGSHYRRHYNLIRIITSADCRYFDTLYVDRPGQPLCPSAVVSHTSDLPQDVSTGSDVCVRARVEALHPRGTTGRPRVTWVFILFNINTYWSSNSSRLDLTTCLFYLSKITDNSPENYSVTIC